MFCDTKIILLTLLGFLAALAWGAAKDSPTKGKEKAVSAATDKKLARKQYRASNFWGGRGSSRSGYYGDDDEDEDEDDSGYYGESYGSYEPSYASYGQSYAPQVIQIPQPSYYYQQQQPSIIPYPYPSYQSYGGGYGKKKKKKPICCCSTDKCLEACDPATNTDCACDMRCCARYSTTNPGCASAAGRQVVFLRRFDKILSQEYDDEEIPEDE